MRTIHGRSLLRAGVWVPARFRSADTTVHDFLRPQLAALLLGLVCLFDLMGCADLIVSYSTSSAGPQQAADRPMMIRTLGTDHTFSMLSSVAVAERLRALHAEEPLNILALSGGGTGGAFGAGAVAGLTRSGTRPDFAVVTGVSAGALVAPYAFLGPTWDERLLDAFTSETGEELLQSRGLGVIFGSSKYRGAPLRHLVDAYVSDTMIRAIANEADKGRLLLVGTTDVATGAPVVWDLGSIAKNGGPSARTLLRDVLVASASVPGMFPPVIIRVDEDGTRHDEAHVDGASTAPFFVPPAFLQTPSGAIDDTGRTEVFIIIDGSLGEGARTTRLTAREILTRSIHAGLNHLLLTTLELTAATAQLNGAMLHYSAVPTEYPALNPFDFRASTRRPLVRYAYDCAQAGRLWTAYQRNGTDSGTSRSVVDTQKVPCPADTPFIEYLATHDTRARTSVSSTAPPIPAVGRIGYRPDH
jgi:predicted acylesterase/phospholipase RssA